MSLSSGISPGAQTAVTKQISKQQYLLRVVLVDCQKNYAFVILTQSCCTALHPCGTVDSTFAKWLFEKITPGMCGSEVASKELNIFRSDV